jgi:hypothetical protein
MFAAAEPDFESDLPRWPIEQRRQVARGRRCNVKCEVRQQLCDQVGLMRPQLVALAAAEERPAPLLRLAGLMRIVMIVGIAACRAHRKVW